MDHLPVPQNPVRPKIEVPYLCQIPYNGKGFKEFPQRCGFELDEKGCVRPKGKGSERAMLGFYQTWLYFGLIMEFFRYPVENGDLPPIEMEDFVRPSDVGGSPIICSVKLTDMINIWGRAYHSPKYYGFKITSARKPSPTIESLRGSVEHALLKRIYLDQVHVVGTWQIEGAYEVILSIKILLNSLLTALNGNSNRPRWYDVYPSRPLLERHMIKPWDYALCCVPPSGTLLERHMINHGWCPFRLHHTFVSFPYNTIYYLACLPKNGRRIADHTHCLEAKMCKGDSINNAIFRCQHTSACDGACPARAPPMEKVKSILDEGGIPLIECSPMGADRLELDVVKATKGVTYTAISHVWADGLGNTLDNSMPDCQLQRLLIFLLESLDIGESKDPRCRLCISVVFWMDVLCIPVGNENEHLKTSAIARMTPTYNGAADVLMLDSDLLETSSHGTPIEEIYARVVKSAWQGRYWTLQEGLLAPMLLVQTQDRAFRTADRYDKAEILDSVKSASYDHKAIVASIRGAIYRDAVGYGPSALGPEYGFPSGLSEYRNQQFIQVWNDLLGRSKTKFEDIHCILANLLDFNAAEILRLPPNNRMKAMLCAQKELPLDLLCGQSPRIESDDGSDRWVPAYPRGLLIEWDYHTDYIALVNEGLYYCPGRYCPSDRIEIIWLDAGVPRLPRFCVETEGEKKWWIQTHTDRIVPAVNESINHPTCLIMNAGNGDVRSHGYCGSGARLSMARLDDHGLYRIRAKFDCSFSFGLWSWGQTDPAFEDIPGVTGRRLPGEPILIETDILAQYGRLTRRPPDGATRHGGFGHFLLVYFGLFTTLSAIILICVVSYFDRGTFFIDLVRTVLIVFLIFILVLLFLALIKVPERSYDRWRRSFADEQTSTERQNHWYSQVSRYTLFSWWKKLRQGPWNALRRRRYTAIPEYPLEPIERYFDEPPGQALRVLEGEEVAGFLEIVSTHHLSDHRVHVYPHRVIT